MVNVPGPICSPVRDRRVEDLLVEPHEPLGVVGDDRHVVDAVEQHGSPPSPRTSAARRREIMVPDARTRNRMGVNVESTRGRCPGQPASRRCSTSRSSTATSSAARTRKARARACRSTAARSPRRRCGPQARRWRPSGCPTRCTATSCGRAGSTGPCILHVDRDRDGGSFSARHVRAVQDGEVIFSMVASFHAREESATFDAVPDPRRARSVDTLTAPVAVPRRGARGDADARRRRAGSSLRLAVGARVGAAARRSAGPRVRGRVRLRPRFRLRAGGGRRGSPPAARASTTASGSTTTSAPTNGCCSSCGR